MVLAVARIANGGTTEFELFSTVPHTACLKKLDRLTLLFAGKPGPARIAVNRADGEQNLAIHHREPNRAEAPAVVQHSDLYSGSGFYMVLIRFIGFYKVSIRLCKVLIRFYRILTRSSKEIHYSNMATWSAVLPFLAGRREFPL